MLLCISLADLVSPFQAAESLADPTEYENLFPGLKEAFAAESYLRESCLGTTRPARDYPLITVSFKSYGCISGSSLLPFKNVHSFSAQ